MSDAFIILDEAQNTTSEQMKMFLTRIGMRSKAVITGDVTQIDLPLAGVQGLSRPELFWGMLRGWLSAISTRMMLCDTILCD